MNKEPMQKILEHVRQVDIAEHFEISQSAVWQWYGQIPLARVPALKKLCKNKVSYHDMRPDVFPK